MAQDENERLYQLNITYNHVEDRLILKLNTTAGREFIFWITRRLFIIFAQNFTAIENATSGAKEQKTEEAQKAVRDFHRQAVLEKTKFDSNYGKDQELKPIFDQGPKLLVKVEVQTDGSNVVLTMYSVDNTKGVFPLTAENFTAFQLLMQNGAKQAGWVAANSEMETEQLVEKEQITKKATTKTLH